MTANPIQYCTPDISLDLNSLVAGLSGK